MNNNVTKKVVGTSVVAVLGFATLFVGASIASAQFTLVGKNLQFDGIVSSVTPNSLTVLTSSTDPIVIELNGKTKYVGFGSASVGDYINVVSQVKDQHTIAKVIKKTKGGKPKDLYGTQGEEVVVKSARVLSKSANGSDKWITVSSDLNNAVTGGGTDLAFRINSATEFHGTTNYSTLPIGSTVVITGRDTAKLGFVAEVVIVKTPTNHQDDENEGDREDDHRD